MSDATKLAGVRKRTPLRTNRIRRLKHGEAIPASEPRRYRTTDGYIQLRWRVGTCDYVEVLEHRLVMGLPEDDLHVHHINHDTVDNRPDNLVVLTSQEHRQQHNDLAWVNDAVELYSAGHSTVTIGKLLGLDSSTVYRRLDEAGITFRTQKELRELSRAGINVDEIVRQAREERARPSEIAHMMGLKKEHVRSILRDHGVPARREGRPTGSEIALSTARRRVRERSGGLCEAHIADVCTGRGQHVHHVVRRSHTNDHNPELMLDVCLTCHGWIHAHPAISYSKGWLVRSAARRQGVRP